MAKYNMWQVIDHNNSLYKNKFLRILLTLKICDNNSELHIWKKKKWRKHGSKY